VGGAIEGSPRLPYTDEGSVAIGHSLAPDPGRGRLWLAERAETHLVAGLPADAQSVADGSSDHYLH